MSAAVERIVESKWFRNGVIALIAINSIIIGAETYPSVRASVGRALGIADRVIVLLFVVELLFRFAATKPKHRFFASGWNWFDLIVVGAGFIPGAEHLSVLRLLRIIRILRAVTVLPQLQKLVLALLRSLPSLGHIAFLLGLLFFAFGAAGTYLFRDVDPDHFGSLHISMLTLFGVVTLEGWVGVMDTVIKAKPWAWIYFVLFILLGTFVSMNLFVGVIVNNLQQTEEKREEEHEEEVRAILAKIEAKLDSLSRR